MSNLIKHIEKESLSNFVKSAKKILDEKKQTALEIEKLGFSIVNESDDYDDDDVEMDDDEDEEDYEESEPNYDVDIDPSEFDENDLTDLEKAIWGDEDDDELEENTNLKSGLISKDLELTPNQLAYAIENFEHLDELSKKTLASYIKKANWDSMSKAHKSNDPQENKKDSKSAAKNMMKAYKRSKGIEKAANKLAKENFDHLEELSKNTLLSYLKKSNKNYDELNRKHIKSQGKEYTKTTADIERKMVNRDNGDFNANQKIKKMSQKD